MPTDFSDQEATNFESELNRARGYKPVTKKEMRQAYKQYSKVGLKFGTVKKNATDNQLYRKATKTVIDWWKLQQKEKIERKHAKQEAMKDPMRGMQSTWSGGSYSGGGSGAYGGGSSGGMLPDTAMAGPGQGDKPGKKLPDIHERLNAREVRQTLRQMGVPDTWTPPPAAQRNQRTLENWVEQQAQRRDMILRQNGAKAYLNDSVVRDISQRVGFPINPSQVPMRYRQSHKEIRKYLLMLKRSWEQTQQNRQDAGQSKQGVQRTATYLSKVRDIHV
jgi:hypothetical protein